MILYNLYAFDKVMEQEKTNKYGYPYRVQAIILNWCQYMIVLGKHIVEIIKRGDNNEKWPVLLIQI